MQKLFFGFSFLCLKKLQVLGNKKGKDVVNNAAVDIIHIVYLKSFQVKRFFSHAERENKFEIA